MIFRTPSSRARASGSSDAVADRLLDGQRLELEVAGHALDREGAAEHVGQQRLDLAGALRDARAHEVAALGEGERQARAVAGDRAALLEERLDDRAGALDDLGPAGTDLVERRPTTRRTDRCDGRRAAARRGGLRSAARAPPGGGRPGRRGLRSGGAAGATGAGRAGSRGGWDAGRRRARRQRLDGQQLEHQARAALAGAGAGGLGQGAQDRGEPSRRHGIGGGGEQPAAGLALGLRGDLGHVAAGIGQGRRRRRARRAHRAAT